MSTHQNDDSVRPAPVPPTWPLAGTAEFAQMDGAWRADSLSWMQQTLARHVVKPWFPRAIDTERGGFHSELGARWQRLPERSRLLEYQARQTRSMARLADALPEADWMRDGSLDALRYVRASFWDEQAGGLFTLIALDGTPLLAATKHGHGAAYSLGAAAEVYRTTGAQEALDFGLELFAWVDRHFHDAENGGYHGWVTREGRPILTTGDIPRELRQRERDHLGHGIGLKDANVHSDLLEGLAVLAEAGAGETVRKRLDELYDVVAHRFTTPMGAVHYLTDTSLTPVPGLEQFGYPAQVGYRLCRAAAVGTLPLDAALAQARVMADHMLDRAVDNRSHGFFEAGQAVEPTGLAGRDLTVRTHPWWVQTEAAQLLIQVAVAFPAEPRYREAVVRLLAFLEREMFDSRNGGMLRQPLREFTFRQRLRSPAQKADQWKDASHETDMCLRGIRMLGGTPAEGPIRPERVPA